MAFDGGDGVQITCQPRNDYMMVTITKTQRVNQAWAGLECAAPRLPGAVTMDTKIH